MDFKNQTQGAQVELVLETVLKLIELYFNLDKSFVAAEHKFFGFTPGIFEAAEFENDLKNVYTSKNQLKC